MILSQLTRLAVTHRTAPVALRERLAFDDAALRALAAELGEVAEELVPLVTCNRTELYLLGRGEGAAERAVSLLAARAGLPAAELAAHVETRTGPDAARSLFRVAAGLESLVLGEPQILGQVREAAAWAAGAGTIGPVLSRLFTVAVVAGKRARSETAISRGAGSVSQAAVELARATLGDLRGRRALVVGVGEMGQLVARNLVAHGARDVAICNRSPERAVRVAAEIGGRVVPWEALDEALREADIGITATGAHEPVLTRARLAPIAAQRDGRPLLLIDIAVPRDVEPAVATLPGIHVRDIDALHEIRDENLRAREEVIPVVEAIIEEEVAAFAAWCRGRGAVPVIRELRARADAVRQQELERALRRLSHLSERDREVVRALSHGLVSKLLHQPVTRLREADAEAQSDYARALADLFGLDGRGRDA
ncbi:MAG: glutamyl-tRNA reductase [Sphaerobacter sp.]|nr:glutamyl-tRNA reductase [Sphaerobacter sp.]